MPFTRLLSPFMGMYVQASFEPPGLTVSVKKDRSMEPLLQIGNKFAISTVAEGKDKVVMRRWVME